MLDSMELQIARRKIQSFESDADGALVRASKLAQDCLDCEQMLDKGIQSLHWLERAEQAIAEGAAEGLCAVTPELDAVLETLHRDWLKPCQLARQWIANCQQSGFEIRNLAEFLEACDRAQDWLDRNDHYQRAKTARDERFAQEPW